MKYEYTTTQNLWNPAGGRCGVDMLLPEGPGWRLVQSHMGYRPTGSIPNAHEILWVWERAVEEDK